MLQPTKPVSQVYFILFVSLWIYDLTDWPLFDFVRPLDVDKADKINVFLYFLARD